MLRRTLLELIAVLGLSVDYAAAYLVIFIWNVPTPNSELVLHIAIVFGASLLFGALIANITKTIIYTLASIVIGIGVAMAMILAPPITLGAGPDLINFYMSVGLMELSRLFIIGISFLVLGTLLGSLLAETIKRD